VPAPPQPRRLARITTSTTTIHAFFSCDGDGEVATIDAGWLAIIIIIIILVVVKNDGGSTMMLHGKKE
jgi:hypothetical protein